MYLARAVDGHLQVWAAEEHGGGKHAHRDGLPETAGCGDEHLLGQMIPSIHFQYLLMVFRKRPVRLVLPEYARACANEIVVEHALMERALPASPVQSLQPPSAFLHALEPVALVRAVSGVQVVLDCRPSPLPV